MKEIINVLKTDPLYTFFMVDSENLKEGLHFGLQYIDSITNEYIQEYTMKAVGGSIEIDCGYPHQ